MSSTKTLGNDLTVSLLSEDPFLYAHLVKFEKVSQSADGQIAEKASDYSYITDASFDIEYDDGSKNLSGASNGAQTYVANRLTKVSNVAETTEAKVSNVNLTISSIALNTKFIGSADNKITVTNSGGAGCSIQIVDTANDNWTTLGFSEGDKITISSGDANNGKSVVISSFKNNNYTATCVLPSAVTTNVSNVTNYTITLETDEVTAILNDPASASYNGYINREVSVYKAHIDPGTGKVVGMDDGTKIGGPYLLFKGIISKAKLTDDPTKNSSVNWTLTSHWGDFVRVNGRITSDAEHRALGVNGQPDFGALYRDDYAMDLGFMHGEQAINIISIYQVMETRYKMKKSGFIFKKYKMKEYQVEVDKEVDLRINLDAKRLPIIYGVQRTDSIPIFADSLYSDPAKIYVAYAICEGEVSGLYDIYVDDQSRICIDKNDFDTRSTQTDEGTIDVVCEGRMDRGDTLSSAPSVRAGAQRGFARSAGSYNIYRGGIYSGIGNWFDNYWYEQNLIANSSNVNGATGIIHEKQTTIKYPIEGRLVFHSGKSHQRADDTLTRIAQAGRTAQLKANGFKLQADTEFPEEYWTSNHRLLDTAYVVAEYEIAEGDVTIPNLEFVVRGKEIEQYNYDYSYDAHPNPVFSSGTIEDKRALFKIGDMVDFYSLASGNPALADDVQIMDSTIYYDADGTAQYKFRFSEDPLAPNPGTTEFYMVQQDVAKTSDTRYPMISWDYKSHSGTVPSALTQAVTTTAGDGNATVSNTDVTNGTGVDVSELRSEIQAILAAAGSGISVGFIAVGQAIADAVSKFMRRQANPATSGGDTTDKDAGGTQVDKDNIEYYAILNAIKLASNASSTDDYYKGQVITVVNTDSEGLQKRQSRKIIKYTGSSKVAVVGALFNVAADASAVSGTFTTTEASWQTKTITLNSVTGLAVDQFLLASSDGLAYIESGTQITAINGLTVTVSKVVRLRKGAVISALASGGANQVKEQPTDFDFVPIAGDTYQIASEGDKKVSINPAIQLLDYLTDGRYGRGLELDKDINLDTFRQSARLCDTRSDISLILPNSGTYTVGDKWKFVNTISSTDYFQWQGTIKATESLTAISAASGQQNEVYKIISSGDTDFTDASASNSNVGTTFTHDGTALTGTGTIAPNFTQVTFSDCIGKIVHKWFDWKTYEVGNAVYHRVGEVNKVYMVSAAGTISEPNTGNAASLAITKVGTSTTVDVHGVSSAGATESNSGERDNPVVKSWNGGNFEKSGYELYDSDDVKYWRYMGWQDHNQREVTRHQTNALIRTDAPLFDNVNSMLKHFNGMLRYSNGKYELDVESTTPTIAATNNITTSGSYTGSAGASNTSAYKDPRIIEEGDIIGAITVDDSGLKGIANTVSVSIADPNIRYDTRSVSFFKSEYLKEDRNIPKKKDVKTPLITNYYNARINAEQYLDQSRFSRKINFVIGPQGVLLLAGTIIKMNYERFGWVNKEFRISNLSYRPDCSVQVTAEEHNDDTYIVSAKEKTYQAAGPISAPGDELPAPKAPANLTATGADNKITLNWTNTLDFGNLEASGGASAGWSTEIYYNNHASFTNTTADTEFSNGAVKIHTTQGQETWEHFFPDITSDTTRYYWVRHIKTITKPSGARTKKLSPFNPVNTGNGVAGVAEATPVTSTCDIFLYKAANSVAANEISADADFPSIVVTMDHGSTHGTITGVTSGQDSDMAITGGQVIDGAGAGTGWFITSQSLSESAKNLYRVYKHISTQDDSVNITKADWGPPLVQGGFGADGEDGEDGAAGAAGASVGHNASVDNLQHTFIMDSAGATTNDFSSGTTVIHTDGTAFTYAASGTTVKTYKITISEETGGVASGQVLISNTGVISIHNDSNIIDTSTVMTASFKATIKDNGNSDRILGVYVFKLTKIPVTTRDGLTKTYISEDYAAAWATSGDVTDTVSAGVIALILADSSVLKDSPSQVRRVVPNDRITIKHTNTASPPVTTVATRIFDGTTARSSGGVGADWSPPVTAEFDGSVIVDGTLSADKLAANLTLTNQLYVHSIARIGQSNSDANAKLYSFDKTAVDDDSNGFYMDGSGDFAVGGSTGGSLVFDASANSLTFDGTLKISDGGTATTLDLSNNTAFNTYIAGKAPIQSVTVGGASTTISNGVLQLAASTGDSLSDTTVGAGFIVLRTAYTGQSDGSIEFDTGTPSTAQKTNAIVLETSASTNRITIYDNTTARVIIGKL